MINKKIMISVISTASLMSSNVLAGQPGVVYGGIQYASLDATISVDGTTIPEDFSPTALIGRVGSNINQNFSIEGRLGLGLSDDTITATDGVDTASLSVELDTLIGVYGIGHIMLNETSSVYGLIGFSKLDGTITASLTNFGSASISEDESGLSYGIGADIGVGNNVALNLEYVQYLNKSDFDVSALAAGVKFGF
jgi:opacity protein-like surface antigen